MLGDMVLVAALVLFLHATTWFVLSLATKDSSVADIAWGSGFIFVALALLFACKQPNAGHFLTSALVCIWGFRLTAHIAIRKIGKPEDWRYTAWRKAWGKWFALRSYLQNFLFQAFLALIISAPVIVAASHSSHPFTMGFWQYLGLTLWTVGFLFEVISDRQLSKFVKNRSSKNLVMNTGLWRFSRHPNYFGEIVLWWGIWLIAAGLPYGLLAIASPLLITYLLVFVSGVPLLEAKYKDNKNYQSYKKVTSKLVPLPPKKLKSKERQS